MSQVDQMPPESASQRACREFWSAQLARQRSSACWSRDARHGGFLHQFARDAHAAWVAAIASAAAPEPISQAERDATEHYRDAAGGLI